MDRILIKNEADEKNKPLSKITDSFYISISNIVDLLKRNVRKDIRNVRRKLKKLIIKNSRNKKSITIISK